MQINEYEMGARNIHHNPLIKTTTIDVPGNSTEYIRNGNVGVQNGNEFHFDPVTKFEYGKDSFVPNSEEEIMMVQSIDLVIESAIKAGIPFEKIKIMVESLSSGAKDSAKKVGKSCGGNKNKVTNGTGKDCKIDKSKDCNEYPDDNGVDKFKDSIINKSLNLGLSFNETRKILEFYSYDSENEDEIGATHAPVGSKVYKPASPENVYTITFNDGENVKLEDDSGMKFEGPTKWLQVYKIKHDPIMQHHEGRNNNG